MVLSVTHAPPRDPANAVEIAAATKRRLGLDGERSWIVIDESNRFTGPGPDLRPERGGDAATVAYGELPRGLSEDVRKRWLELRSAGKTQVFAKAE